jgi:hypothetical protein
MMSTDSPASSRPPVRSRQDARRSQLSGDRLVYGAVVAAVAVGYFLCFRSSGVLPKLGNNPLVGEDVEVHLRPQGWTTQEAQDSGEEAAPPAPHLATTPVTVEVPEEIADQEAPDPSSDDFEKDEEVQQIKREMREEVESQAIELGPSTFITEKEWENHLNESDIQSRSKAAVMGGYLADAACLGLQGWGPKLP